MNTISYILKYIIMIMIFFIIIKSIAKSKCSNINLINIIMISIIIHYLFKIFSYNSIKEKFGNNYMIRNSNNSNVRFFYDKMDEPDGEGEEELEYETKNEKDDERKINYDIKMRELEMREKELREREMREKDMIEKEKEIELREREKAIRGKEETQKEKPCNVRDNSIWGKNYDNDLDYNELPEDMMEPLGKIDSSYSYMPPWKWWPPRANPPMCSREAKCSPCPITTMGTPTDVKEWDNSRYVTPGLGINIPYIEKLNRQYNEKV